MRGTFRLFAWAGLLTACWAQQADSLFLADRLAAFDAASARPHESIEALESCAEQLFQAEPGFAERELGARFLSVPAALQVRLAVLFGTYAQSFASLRLLVVARFDLRGSRDFRLLAAARAIARRHKNDPAWVEQAVEELIFQQSAETSAITTILASSGGLLAGALLDEILTLEDQGLLRAVLRSIPATSISDAQLESLAERAADGRLPAAARQAAFNALRRSGERAGALLAAVDPLEVFADAPQTRLLRAVELGPGSRSSSALVDSPQPAAVLDHPALDGSLPDATTTCLPHACVSLLLAVCALVLARRGQLLGVLFAFPGSLIFVMISFADLWSAGISGAAPGSALGLCLVSCTCLVASMLRLRHVQPRLGPIPGVAEPRRDSVPASIYGAVRSGLHKHQEYVERLTAPSSVFDASTIDPSRRRVRQRGLANQLSFQTHLRVWYAVFDGNAAEQAPIVEGILYDFDAEQVGFVGVTEVQPDAELKLVVESQKGTFVKLGARAQGCRSVDAGLFQITARIAESDAGFEAMLAQRRQAALELAAELREKLILAEQEATQLSGEDREGEELDRVVFEAQAAESAALSRSSEMSSSTT